MAFEVNPSFAIRLEITELTNVNIAVAEKVLALNRLAVLKDPSKIFVITENISAFSAEFVFSKLAVVNVSV